MYPVVRSKGFCWIASRNDRNCLWGHAGRMVSLTSGQEWWAEGRLREWCHALALLTETMAAVCIVLLVLAVPKEEWPTQVREYIEKIWDEQWGDRQQEIVVIGTKMDKEEVSAHHCSTAIPVPPR